MSAPRKPRRWLQFSLASLLVVVTVVGLFLAPIVNRVQQQSQLVAKIEALGGEVTFGETESSAAWLRGWLDDDYFRTVRGVTLRSCGATDQLLAEIAELQTWHSASSTSTCAIARSPTRRSPKSPNLGDSRRSTSALMPFQTRA